MKAKELAAKLLENPDSDVFVYPPTEAGFVHEVFNVAILPNKTVLLSSHSKMISNEEERIVGIAYFSK